MPSGTPSADRSPRRALLGALLVGLLAALVFAECQPLHVHAGEGLGLYNETHVLSALAAVGGEVPLSDLGPATAVPPFRALSLPPLAAPTPSAARSLVGPRAPPLA